MLTYSLRKETFILLFSLLLASCYSAREKLENIAGFSESHPLIYKYYQREQEHEIRRGLYLRSAKKMGQQPLFLSSSDDFTIRGEWRGAIKYKKIRAGEKIKISLSAIVPASFSYHCIVAKEPVTKQAKLLAASESWNNRGRRTKLLARGLKFVDNQGRTLVDRRFLLLSAAVQQTREEAEKSCRQMTKKFGSTCNVQQFIANPASSQIDVQLQGNKEKEQTVYQFDSILELMAKKGQKINWSLSDKRQLSTTSSAALIPDRDRQLLLIETIGLEKQLLNRLLKSQGPQLVDSALKALTIVLRSQLLAAIGNEKVSKPYDVELELDEQNDPQQKRLTDCQRAIEQTAGLVIRQNQQLFFPLETISNGGYSGDPQQLSDGQRSLYKSFFDGQILPGIKLDLSNELNLEKWLTRPLATNENEESKNISEPYRWVRAYTPLQIKNLFPQIEGKISQIKVVKRDTSGRARRLHIISKKGRLVFSKSQEIYHLFHLPSSLFIVRRLKTARNSPLLFVFYGAGQGSGLGLSHYGAAGLNQQNYTFLEILRHYYKDIKVVNYLPGKK